MFLVSLFTLLISCLTVAKSILSWGCSAQDLLMMETKVGSITVSSTWGRLPELITSERISSGALKSTSLPHVPRRTMIS